MITCCKCKEDKLEDMFPWRNKSKGLRQAYCKECKKSYNRTWYSNDKNKRNQIRRATANNKKYIQKLIEWKSSYVENNGGCSYKDCEVRNPIMIDFDHIDRTAKSFNIADMFRLGYSIEKIEEEAAKCRLLCANHHRLWTAEQLGWASFVSVSALPPK